MLDILSEAGLIFREAVQGYFADGTNDRFTERLERVAALESRGDELRRAIEVAMYSETLMPDLRGDVLRLPMPFDSAGLLLPDRTGSRDGPLPCFSRCRRDRGHSGYARIAEKVAIA